MNKGGIDNQCTSISDEKGLQSIKPYFSVQHLFWLISKHQANWLIKKCFKALTAVGSASIMRTTC
ncbi:hypothetical protein [Zooshikella harenae]|uniref:Uncharacterized protein n=1 Tax=Zooshikella harenae TaxID=2827238 RepID=A0ABS5ZC03_9GAMM|nr:hypothetical protein [Zooshikella harenae]MBU2711592.1 hypothetical protein [Zooshikella harenae]